MPESFLFFFLGGESFSRERSTNEGKKSSKNLPPHKKEKKVKQTRGKLENIMCKEPFSFSLTTQSLQLIQVPGSLFLKENLLLDH